MAEEWTAEWLQKLDHKFGDDGSFWISYDDLLRKYQAFDRTRLFSSEWKVASIWTTLDVSLTLDYHDTKFAFSLFKSGPVVIVFSQLDERYFKGLEGQYRFELSFRVHKAGEEDYVVRSQNYYRMNRSVNVELDLDAGEYVVVVKVDAQRNEQIMPVEEVVRAHAKERREKLLRIGQAYDLAHAKGKILETAEEKEAREAFETRRRERDRKKMAKLIQNKKAAVRKTVLRQRMRDRRRKEKAEAKAKTRAERKAARREARAKAQGEEKKQDEKKEEFEGQGRTGEEKTREEVEAENYSMTVTADEKPGDVQSGGDQTKESSGTSENEEAESKMSTEDKHVKVEAPSDASTASTEPGEGAQTPASSTISSKRPAEGEAQTEAEETQEDDAYVTATEEALEKISTSPKEEPATPKPTKSTNPPPPKSVDIGVQTGPGLPMPPLSPPLPPLRRGPPPPQYLYMQSVYGHPPPPLPGAHYGRGPPRDCGRMPAQMRATYAARNGPHGPPVVSETELSSGSSNSELDENIDDDLSDLSDEAIEDLMMDEARARRAATAAAAKVAPPSGSAPVVEEPLDEFEKDPWNAVGVFGLRVYYKMPEDGTMDKDAEVVKLRVERPNYYVWDESSDEEADDEKEDDKKQESQVLDVDDSAKDAVGETPPTPGVELLKELSKGKGGEKAGEVFEKDDVENETTKGTVEDTKSSNVGRGQTEAEEQ